MDLLVTDYKMPGMNGLQLLAEAQKLAPGIPHVMVSAFEVIDPYIHSPGRVLHKPFGAEEFLGAVEEALAEAEG